MHRSRCMFNLVSRNFLFRKLTMLIVHSSWIDSRTWILAIFISLIYSKSLWLRIANTKTLHQIQRIRFKWLSFYETSLDSWIMVILKNDVCKSRVCANNKVLSTNFPQPPTLQWAQKVCFNTFKCKNYLFLLLDSYPRIVNKHLGQL